MQIEIEVLPGSRLRALLFNDTYAPVEVLRNSFVGPSVAGMPPSVEATFGGADEPLTLHPFTYYGRERDYAGLPAGDYRVTATYTDAAGATLVTETDLTTDGSPDV
jgi:hypothetical protein